MNNHLIHREDTPTSSTDDEITFDTAVFDTAVQHCFERLDKLALRLHRYPIDAVTVAMGTYFQELLSVLFDEGASTVDDVRAFLRDIESVILEPKDSSTENNAVPISAGDPRSALWYGSGGLDYRRHCPTHPFDQTLIIRCVVRVQPATYLPGLQTVARIGLERPHGVLWFAGQPGRVVCLA